MSDQQQQQEGAAGSTSFSASSILRSPQRPTAAPSANTTTTVSSVVGGAGIDDSRRMVTHHPTQYSAQQGVTTRADLARSPGRGGGAAAYNASSSYDAIVSVREDNAHKDRLLRDAQQQVRDLLPKKEESARLRSDLAASTDRLAALEDENRKLRRLLEAERTDREATIATLSGKQNSLEAELTAKMRRSEERVREKDHEVASLQRELERKQRIIAALEDDVQNIARGREVDKEDHAQLRKAHKDIEEELTRTHAKIEEYSRGAVKADATKATYAKQIDGLEDELSKLRADLDAVKRKKGDLLNDHTQVMSERDGLRKRLHEITSEVEEIPRLQHEISSLLAGREELASLRSAMETSDLEIMNERSTRRTLEMEREQLQLQVRSLEVDVKRMDEELHRVQLDAAEKHALRRESEEIKNALEISHRTTTELQHQLGDLRTQLSKQMSDHETMSNSAAQESGSLRQFLEYSLTVSPAQLQAAATHNNTSTNLNKSGQSHQNGDTSGVSSSSMMVDVPSSMQGPPPTSPRRGIHDPRVEALFVPLRSLAAEMAETLHEERRKKAHLTRMVDSEQGAASRLQESLRVTNASAAEAQERIAEADRQREKVKSELAALQTAYKTTVAEASGRLNALRAALQIRASGDGDGGGVTWDSVVVAAHEAHHKATILKSDLETAQLDAKSLAKKMAAQAASHKEASEEADAQHKDQVKSLRERHHNEIQEAAKVRTSLEEAVKKAQKRHDALTVELGNIKKDLETSIKAEAERTSELTASHNDVAVLAEKLSRQEDATKEATGTLAESVKARAALDDQLGNTKDELNARTSRLEVAFRFLILLVRALIGIRNRLQHVSEQRNIAMQTARLFEGNLRELASETNNGEVVRTRVTARVTTLVVMAALRLQRLGAQARARAHAAEGSAGDGSGSTAAGTGKSGGRGYRALLTARQARDFDMVQLAPPKLASVRFAMEETDAETVDSFISQFDVSLKAQQDNTVLLRLASGLNRSRLAKVGPQALVRAASIRHRNKVKDMTDEKQQAEQTLTTVKSENSHLVAMVQMKEAQNQKFSAEIAQLLTEKSRMVDGRRVEVLEQELHRTRSTLEREKEERKGTEDRLNALRRREMDLLSHQNNLQNEARSMAMELATRTSSARSQLAAAPSEGPTPGGATTFERNEGDRTSSPTTGGYRRDRRPSTDSYGALSGVVPVSSEGFMSARDTPHVDALSSGHQQRYGFPYTHSTDGGDADTTGDDTESKRSGIGGRTPTSAMAATSRYTTATATGDDVSAVVPASLGTGSPYRHTPGAGGSGFGTPLSPSGGAYVSGGGGLRSVTSGSGLVGSSPVTPATPSASTDSLMRMIRGIDDRINGALRK